MMNRFVQASLICLVATPSFAFDRMDRSSCRDSYEKFAEMIGTNAAERDRRVQSIGVSPDSWCQIRSGAPGFEDENFETVEWRTENTDMWTDQGIPPLSLQLRIAGLDPDVMQGNSNTLRPDVNVEATLRQIEGAGIVTVERAVMENNAGDRITFSGAFERMFLSSPSMVQVSMGSATFKAGLFTMTLSGRHENPFGFNTSVEMSGSSNAQFDAAFGLISGLPAGVIDDSSRAELTAFAADLPKPIGELEVSIASEQGLGIMQVGVAAAMTGASLFTSDSGRNQMEAMLDGVTVSVDWAPDDANDN